MEDREGRRKVDHPCNVVKDTQFKSKARQVGTYKFFLVNSFAPWKKFGLYDWKLRRSMSRPRMFFFLADYLIPPCSLPFRIFEARFSSL